MGRKQEYLENVAANNDCTLAELKETEEKLQSAIQSRLNKHWKRSRLRSGEDYWLYENGQGVWLAFNEYELREELREAKIECDTSLVKVVAFGHLEEFQQGGATIAVPGGIARYHKSDLWYPIYVPFPDEWQNGEWHSLQRLQELVSRYELSPAEALDYWAVEHHNEDGVSWGGKRNVQPEAIRKNVRQAKEKLDDEDLGAAHEKERFRVVPTDEVPDENIHDEEKDLFYIPTEEQADEVSVE
jgi:hypothetical protein